MRVLLVHKFFHTTGGAEVFFFETARILQKYGHEVALFSTNNKDNYPSLYSSYFVDPPDFMSGSLVQKVKSIQKIIYSKEAKSKLNRLIKDFKPDIVHVFAMFTHLSPSILEACTENSVPVVLSCNDYKHICPNYKLYHHGKLCDACKMGHFYHSIVNRCCQDSYLFSIASCIEATVHRYLNIVKKHIHTFLFASEFMARKTEECWGKESFCWEKLHNPFDSTKYCPSEEYADYFLFFGRMVEEKGVHILLKAMQYASSTRLILVGDGPEFHNLQKLAINLCLKNVEFVGPKWSQELDDLLRLARFVVVPSIWHENFPYVIVQAFAMGKAVIGTDRGGIPELIVDGEFGYIYPAESPESLGEKINLLWHNPQLTAEMGKKAKKYADSVFNDNVFYDTLMYIYHGVFK